MHPVVFREALLPSCDAHRPGGASEREEDEMDIQVSQEYLEKAVALHERCPVVDAHLDLAGEILLRHKAGEEQTIRKHYLKDFRTGRVRLVFSSIYVENGELDHAWENAVEQIEALKTEIARMPEIALVCDRNGLNAVLAGAQIGILIYMEGLECIGEDVDKLNELYRMGVRGASLTWSRKGPLATGCCRASEYRQIPGGLTKAGIQAVKRIEELSMFLDVSHLNDEGYEEVCRIAQKPFLATHSGSRAVYDSYRNMTDRQMQALADRGGIMGMNGCKYIAGSLNGNHLEMLCRHIEHEVKETGAAHVGYGFDLCDSYGRAKAALRGGIYADQDDCLLSHSQVPLVTAALLQRGMSEEDACRIIGGNFMDYLWKTLP